MFILYSGKILEGKFWKFWKKPLISENSLFLLYLEMALLKCFMLKQCNTMNTCSECLPDSSGPLAITIPSGSIIATNSSIVKMLEKQQKQAETKDHVVNTEYIRIMLLEYIRMV